MNTSRRARALVRAVALGVIVWLTPSSPARAASTVTVVNGTSNPVPTASQGTTTVAGAVSITGTPTVTVTNLPATQAVSVNNFPATQSVNVANGAAAPVQVADVERMARIPYMSSVFVNCTAGSSACFFNFASPPAGTRLVAENLSGYFQIAPTATAPVVGYVEDGSPSFTVFTAFTAPLAGLDPGGHTQAAFSQPARFYVNGGDSVFAVVSTTWSNGANTVVLSGYLESCAVTGCPAIAH